MNQQSRGGVERSGPVSHVLAFLVARPDSERVTVVDRVVVFLSRVSMLLILAGVAITFFEIVMRYVFNSPTTWAYKKTLWLGAIIYLISGAYAMQRRSHIRITAVYKMVPRRLRLIFDYLTLFVMVVYATLMLVGGTELATGAFFNWIQSGRLLDPSIPGTIKPLVLIITVLVVVVAINNLLIDHCGFGRTHHDSQSNEDVS